MPSLAGAVHEDCPSGGDMSVIVHDEGEVGYCFVATVGGYLELV